MNKKYNNNYIINAKLTAKRNTERYKINKQNTK